MSRCLIETLQACERRNVRLAAKPEGLSIRGELTPELREDLKWQKPNVLHYLTTGKCHHDLEPSICKLCNGYVRRLIASDGRGGKGGLRDG